MMKRGWPIAVTIATAVVLAGCSTSAPDEHQEPTSSTNTEGRTEVLPGVINEEDGEIYTPNTPAVWDDATRSAAIDAAQKAMVAYARPKLDKDTWWAELEPLLSDRARADYAYVDPSAIPVSKVIGQSRITDDESTLIATVTVPTDKGDYEIYVNRIDGADPWRIARFIPPEGMK